MLRVRVAPRPDGEAAVVSQGRGHRRGVHVLWQLTLVCKGVHDCAVSRQLLSPHLDVVVGGGDDDVLGREVAHVHSELVGVSQRLDVARPPGTGWEGQRLRVWPHEAAELLGEHA